LRRGKEVGAEPSSLRVERDLRSGLSAVVAAADRAEALRGALDRCAFKSELFAAGNSDAPSVPQEGRASSPIYRGRTTKILERAKGIEPSYEAWEASVLPLNYARSIAKIPIGMAGEEGLEPPTPGFGDRCSTN
jgi:hypothetical protein